MKARSMLFTLYGDSIEPSGGLASARALVGLMSALGFSPPAVRAALGRMVRQEWLERQRLGSRSYYTLTPRGQLRVRHGTSRVYGTERRTWDGRWRILAYSVPESRRATRDRLRRELAWLGMAPLAGGTWVSPYDLHEHIDAFVESHRLQPHVVEFKAENLGPISDQALVARCWDLASIERWHEAFLKAFGPRLADLEERLLAGNRPGDQEAFVEKIHLVHEYRKALYVDPWLPHELLPPDWPGLESARLFFDYYRLLEGPARRFFEHIFDTPGDPALKLTPASKAPTARDPSTGLTTATS